MRTLTKRVKSSWKHETQTEENNGDHRFLVTVPCALRWFYSAFTTYTTSPVQRLGRTLTIRLNSTLSRHRRVRKREHVRTAHCNVCIQSVDLYSIHPAETFHIPCLQSCAREQCASRRNFHTKSAPKRRRLRTCASRCDPRDAAESRNASDLSTRLRATYTQQAAVCAVVVTDEEKHKRRPHRALAHASKKETHSAVLL